MVAIYGAPGHRQPGAQGLKEVQVEYWVLPVGPLAFVIPLRSPHVRVVDQLRDIVNVLAIFD